MVIFDGIELRRFPESDFLPIEDCYAQCEQAGFRVVPMSYVARLRASHPEKNSPAWTEVKGAYSGSVVGTGCLEDVPTIVVAHANHPLMTSESIREFKSNTQRFIRGGIRFSNSEVLEMIRPYREIKDSKRDIWVIQSKHLTNPKVWYSGIVPATIDGTIKTILVPFLGDKDIANSYLTGHNNFSKQIGIYFDENTLKSNDFLFRPLWFGGYDISLVGDNNFDGIGCVFGMKLNTTET